VVRDLLRPPSALGIVVGTLLLIITTRSRFARVAVFVSPVFILWCMEVGRFDGQRHVNQMFDATFFVWVQTLALRALAGLALVLLAAPVGAAIDELLSTRRGALLGLATLGPCGMGQLASSVLVLREVPRMLSMPAVEDKLVALRTVVVEAGAVLGVGALLLTVVSVSLGIGLLHPERRLSSHG